MGIAKILFADNHAEFLANRLEFLEGEGYTIIAARTPTEARHVLEGGDVDLAILDIRLRDDDDEKDTSGLTLAKELAPSVPKIILTDYPDYQFVRTALKTGADGKPPAVDFLAKGEGLEAMLRAVRRALDRGAVDYDLVMIQQLVQDAFTARELTWFCRDRKEFRPFLDIVGASAGIREMAYELVGCCERQILIEELLLGIKQENPRRWLQYKSKVYAHSSES